MHISEIDRNYVKDVHDHLRETDVVQAKVIAIKEDGKIDLSIKALQDPAPPRPRRGADPDFEARLKKFMRQSEERQVDFKRVRRAQAQVAPPVGLEQRSGSPTSMGELRGSDRAVVREQLGREPTTPFTVVARCAPGSPPGDPERAGRRRGASVPDAVLAHVSRRPPGRSRAWRRAGRSRG